VGVVFVIMSGLCLLVCGVCVCYCDGGCVCYCVGVVFVIVWGSCLLLFGVRVFYCVGVVFGCSNLIN